MRFIPLEPCFHRELKADLVLSLKSSEASLDAGEGCTLSDDEPTFGPDPFKSDGEPHSIPSTAITGFALNLKCRPRSSLPSPSLASEDAKGKHASSNKRSLGEIKNSLTAYRRCVRDSRPFRETAQRLLERRLE